MKLLPRSAVARSAPRPAPGRRGRPRRRARRGARPCRRSPPPLPAARPCAGPSARSRASRPGPPGPRPRRRARRRRARRQRRSVALGVHLDAVVGGERVPQQAPVLGEQIGIGVAVLAQEAGRPSTSVNRNVTVPAGSSNIWRLASARDVEVGNTRGGRRAGSLLRPGDDRRPAGPAAGRASSPVMRPTRPRGSRARPTARCTSPGCEAARRARTSSSRRSRRAGADRPADRHRRQLAGRQPGRRASARRQRSAGRLGGRPAAGQRRPGRRLVVNRRHVLVDTDARHRRLLRRLCEWCRWGGRTWRRDRGGAGRLRAWHEPRPRRQRAGHALRDRRLLRFRPGGRGRRGDRQVLRRLVLVSARQAGALDAGGLVGRVGRLGGARAGLLEHGLVGRRSTRPAHRADGAGRGRRRVPRLWRRLPRVRERCSSCGSAGSRSRSRVASGIEHLGIASGPAGRLWLFWSTGDGYVVTRSNRAATRFESVTRVALPAAGAATYGLYGEGSAGTLDLVAHAGSGSSIPAGTRRCSRGSR